MARAGKDIKEEVSVATSLIRTLSQMDFCCRNDISPIPLNQYRDAMNALQSLGNRRGEHLNFEDCHLSDAHILILFEILSRTHRCENLGLRITGEQNFSLDFLTKNIIKMLEINSNAIYTMVLPSELSNNKRINELWVECTGGDANRVLSFEIPEAHVAAARVADEGAAVRPAGSAAAASASSKGKEPPRPRSPRAR